MGEQRKRERNRERGDRTRERQKQRITDQSAQPKFLEKHWDK